MFDKNSYAVLFPLFIFFLLDSMLVINSIRQREDTPYGKTFFKFMFSATLLQFVTLLTYCNDYHLISLGIVTLTIANSIGVVFVSVTGCFWMLFILDTDITLFRWNTPIIKRLLAAPVYILIAMTVTSPWTHWIFYLDENRIFQNGSLMIFQMISYLYFLFALILYIYQLIKGGHKGSSFKRFAYYMIPGLLGGLANIYLFRGGYTQIGVSVSAILIYMEQFMAEINENKRLRSIDAINKQLMQANEEIKAARDEAYEANNAKSKFLFNMSHDIRTPMNAILGYTDIGLKHFEDSAKVKESLLKINNSGTHLLKLINNILEMSRIETGLLEIHEEPLDIRKAIETVGNMSKALAHSKNINMEVTIGEIKNPYIYADELHINEALINLVSNAIKYTHPGGNVEYRIRQLDDAADGRAAFQIEIIDNGIGMTEEFQAHMFDSFARESNQTISKIEGTGLGLSIVKHILELANGTITIKSKQNVGTTVLVTISFRVMDEEAIREYLSKNAPIEAQEKMTSLQGKRILYAEDNEINREIGIELLNDVGVTVDTAEDGSIALAAVRQKGINYYDAILMDIQMPVMNGYEATQAIRQLPDGDSVPIIALSANAFQEDIQQSLQSGMNAHVSKPINTAELLRVLESFIR